MTLQAFLAALDKLAALKPTYRLGGKGRDGTCDCIGLIMYGVEETGGKWPGIHGSNWAARNVTDGLRRVSGADDLAVGDVIYKAKAPGQSGYNLPGRYSGHPDRRDYYHVGVVRGVSPLRIRHCTSPGGIREDGKLGSWGYAGRLSLLDGEEAEGPGQAAAYPTIRQGSRGNEVAELQLRLRAQGYDLEPDGIFGPMTRECLRTYQSTHGLDADGVAGPKTWAALLNATDTTREQAADATRGAAARVDTPNGLPVKIRASPSREDRLWWEAPAGAVVDVLAWDAAPGWHKVRYGGKEGYMMAKYLKEGDEA